MSPPSTSRRQARGNERRTNLVFAAIQLLETVEVSEITIPMVAKKAGVPTSSAYHFYSEPKLILIEAARRLAMEFADVDFEPPREATWKELTRSYIAFGAKYYNSHAPMRKLMLSGSTTAEISEAGRIEDARFAKTLEECIANRFVLESSLELSRAFELAIYLSDAVFGLSVKDLGRIDDVHLAEASQAVIAYLNLFIPDNLPARSQAG